MLLKNFLPCLNTDKAAGIGQISEKFLKETTNNTAYPMAKIINW